MQGLGVYVWGIGSSLIRSTGLEAAGCVRVSCVYVKLHHGSHVVFMTSTKS